MGSTDDDSDSSYERRKKEKKKKDSLKKKDKKKKYDSDSDSDDSSKKTKKKKEKSTSLAAPRTPKSQKSSVGLQGTDPPKTPRNIDGSLWKNPLNRWTNMPDTSRSVTEQGTQIIVSIPPKTDCTRHIDTAPFNWHKVSGDFEVMVKVSGDLSSVNDKAGLMIRLDDQNWILTGMELVNGRINHTTCVTRDVTDWSLGPLPENAEKLGVWFCLKRMANYFETYYSFDARKWIQTRQGIFTERPVLTVGICGACPTGKGFKVVFDCYRVKTI